MIKLEIGTRNDLEQLSASNIDPKSGSQVEQEREHVLILGSGFGGIEVLKRLQKEFHNGKNNVDIILVSRDNFLLFTPMLPEVSTGRIETRHIVTPVRSFINDNNKSKNVRFHEADIESIDLHRKQVIISHCIGGQTTLVKGNNNSDIEQEQPQEQQRQQWQGQQEQEQSQLIPQPQPLSQPPRHKHTLNYDYLVIAPGSDTNFFGIEGIRKYAFIMEEIDDAIALNLQLMNVCK